MNAKEYHLENCKIKDKPANDTNINNQLEFEPSLSNINVKINNGGCQNVDTFPTILLKRNKQLLSLLVN